MKARTHDDDRIVEVEITSAPNKNKLCKVLAGERTLVRHVDRLEPLEEEARKILGK